MTTIAWDGKTLAVDSRVTIGSDIFDDNYKKMQKSVGIFAAVVICGDPNKAESYIRDTLSEISNPEDLWTLDMSDNYSIVGVLHTGDCWFLNGDNTYTLPTPWAYGSGGDYAIAAMDHGKNAVESVKYASTRDSLSNSRVYHYTVKLKEDK